ncbi:MAG: hypothetical protein GY811_27845 [Myxococcales bacterium]|nr:hypothetical protein [Myxococcales bacterium]
MAVQRHGLAAAITMLIAMALAAAVAGRGCNRDSDGPTEAVRAFMQASKSGNRDAALKMLGPKTRAQLERAALRATKLVGGEGRYQARDVLQLHTTGPDADSIVNMGRDGDQASISITDSHGKKSTIITVLVDGNWLLELADSRSP